MKREFDWKVLSTREIFQVGFFKVRADRCEMPDGRVVPNYYVMEFSDWVQIVPVTKDGELVMVNQYRHAFKQVCLEVPGGAMNTKLEKNPAVTAERELLEETGYKAEKIIHIANHCPNPAIHSNRLHTFLALNCQWAQEQQLDPYEDLEVVKLPVQEVLDMAFRGDIKHSLVLTSLLLAIPHFKNLGFIK